MCRDHGVQDGVVTYDVSTGHFVFNNKRLAGVRNAFM
jgi:hypothetical protein